MRGRGALGLVLWAVAAVAILGVLAGQVVGYPVILGFVETGSMEPTLAPGDGFVAVPTVATGPVEPGDVIVFEAEVIDGGGLTTHRVVGETDGGFITRGDANVVTDQDSGEPPVRRGRIVAEALQIGDWLVVVPKIGLVAGAVQSILAPLGAGLGSLAPSQPLSEGRGIAYLLFGGGVAAYLWIAVSERRADDGRGEPSRGDGAVDAALLVLAVAFVLGVVVTGSMLLGGETHEFDVVSAEQDSPRPYVIERGTSEDVIYTMPSYGALPAAVFLEPASENVDVEPTSLYVPSGSSVNATVTLTAPPETGHEPQYLVEHRYVGVLPMATMRSLHEVHPWLPVVAIDGLVGVGVVGLGWGLFGNRRVRLDSRKPERPLRYRIRRWLR